MIYKVTFSCNDFCHHFVSPSTDSIYPSPFHSIYLSHTAYLCVTVDGLYLSISFSISLYLSHSYCVSMDLMVAMVFMFVMVIRGMMVDMDVIVVMVVMVMTSFSPKVQIYGRFRPCNNTFLSSNFKIFTLKYFLINEISKLVHFFVLL